MSARLAVTLRAATCARIGADKIADRLKAAAEKSPGATVYIEPVQDIQITTRPSRSQYQYTLTSRRQRRAARLVRTSCLIGCARRRRCAMSPPRRRMAACAPSCTSTAKRWAGSASPRKWSTTRSTTLSASGRFRPSTRSRTNIASFSKRRRNISAIRRRSKSSMSRRSAAARRRRSRRSCASTMSPPPLSVAHQDQFPAATISFDLADGFALGDAVKTIAQAEARDRHAVGDHRRLQRRRRRIQQIAGERALAHSRGDRRRFMSCSACSTRASRIPSPC